MVFVLATEVIVLYAGDKYLACIPTLMLACIGRVFISCESVLTNLVMYPNNQEKNLLRFLFTGGIINLILNFFNIILI